MTRRLACALVVTIAAAAGGAGAGGGAAAPAPAPAAQPEPSDAALHRKAREALEAGRWDEAIEHFDALRRRHPDVAEIAYNMGVAAYRKGDLEQAAQLFRDAQTLAADPALRARSAYNLGTTEYRRAVSPGPGQTDASSAAAGLDEAGRRVAEALRQFRDSLDQDPGDVDARANGELAQQLLERLRQMKQQLQQQQQQQQQQNQQQQQDQGQDQGQGQGQGQDGQQEEPPQQGEQPRPQGEQGQEQEQQEQQEQPSRGEEGPQEKPHEQGSEPQAGETKAAESPEWAPQPSGEAAGPGEETREDRKPMSRQEAERLLQGVRDKERKRRDEEARKLRAGKPRVDKDW